MHTELAGFDLKGCVCRHPELSETEPGTDQVQLTELEKAENFFSGTNFAVSQEHHTSFVKFHHFNSDPFVY